MKLFNCNVRLGGNVLHDVPKYGLSEMEIRVLQSMHGDDAVYGIKSAGEVERSDHEEASILADTYGAKRVSEVSGIKTIAPLVIDDAPDEPQPAPAFSADTPAAAAALE